MSTTDRAFTIPDVTDAGILPIRTADPGEALEYVRRDGAAILTDAGTTAEAAEEAARAVFGSRALAIPKAAEIKSGGDSIVRRNPEEALGVHTDGYSYGEFSPDYFLLLCSQDSEVGGESILVDGYRLLDALGETSEGATVVDLLERTSVNQTEPGMRPAVSPMIGRTPAGRRRVKRFPGQRILEDSATPAVDTALVTGWDQLCRSAWAGAPRFKLAPGEVAVVDNYRTLHGREPYQDPARALWRVWVWTDWGYGVPPGALHSDRRYAAVTTDAAAKD